MKIVTINNNPVTVDDRLDGFQLFQKQSSNVEFFAANKTTKQLFVQFKSGACSYMYSDCPDKILTWAENAESIGRFVSAEVVNKYPVIKIEGKLIKPVPAEQPTV